MKRFITSVALMASLAFGAAGAAAAGPIQGTCAIADVAGAYACSGAFSGNDNNNAVVLSQFQALDPTLINFHLVDRSNNTQGSQEAFLYDTGGGTGQIILNDPTGAWLPTSIFGITLKAGNNYSMYLFDGGVLGLTAGLNSLMYTTYGVQHNGNDIPANLSHASLWGFSPTNSGGCFGDPTFCNPSNVPEPASVALTGAGLMVLGYVTRRRKSVVDRVVNGDK